MLLSDYDHVTIRTLDHVAMSMSPVPPIANLYMGLHETVLQFV